MSPKSVGAMLSKWEFIIRETLNVGFSRVFSLFYFEKFNPLALRDDKHVVSPFDIQTLSNKKVLRILKLIR